MSPNNYSGMISPFRILALLCTVSFFIISVSAVTVTISPDHIEEGDQITAEISGLEDGANLALRMESSIECDNKSDFNYQTDTLVFPFALNSPRLIFTASPVTEAGIAATDGDTIKRMTQRTSTGSVSIIQNLGTIPIGAIDYIKVFGTTVEASNLVDIALELSGSKEGPDSGSIVFGLQGITDGSAMVSISVNGSEITRQHIVIGNPGVRGDFNENGYVDIGDVARVAHMAVGLVDKDLRADFNCDGNVDTADAARIAWYYVGKIQQL
jgi:hypothetical protein